MADETNNSYNDLTLDRVRLDISVTTHQSAKTILSVANAAERLSKAFAGLEKIGSVATIEKMEAALTGAFLG